MRKITLFAIAGLISTISFGQVVINEIDADQTSTDTEEFIELKTDNPNESLDGYVVVLYNGSSDQSYAAYDLDGYTTDANGFLLLANDGFPGQDISLGTDNGLQNGEDAVAIYEADDSDFPNGTSVTDTDLVDALVYGTDDSDATNLLSTLGESVQYNENANGNKDTESIQRAADGTFCVGAPTPKAENIDCSSTCPLSVSVDSVVCDDTTTGIDTYTVTGTFSGGGTDTYDFTINAGTITSTDHPDFMATGSIVIEGIPEDTDLEYTITSSNCDISDIITAPVCEPTAEVSDIAALRAGSEGVPYTLTGEAILTFQQDYRNQKYIEDETAAILIDDAEGNITSTYEIGDGITGITGELTEFNGVLQFTPSEDPGNATSTNNEIEPQIITIQEFTENFEAYESEVIAFENIGITGEDTDVFVAGENYTITTNTALTTTLRTQFYDADYIGNSIPQDIINVIIGIAGEYNGEQQFYPRSQADIDGEGLSIYQPKTTSVLIYPNPVANKNETVNIQLPTKGAAKIQVYNMLGKELHTENVTDAQKTVKLSNLQSGIYLVKVSQGNHTTTKKLIVE